MNSFLKRLAGFAAIVLFACGVNFAQLDTGALSGTVTDPSGAVVSRATVTVKNLQTNAQRTVQSSSNGSYTLSGLSAGQYEVTVESTGFQPFKGQVEITVGGHLTVDAQLSVSSSATQVEVLAEGGTQVNTQNQEISQIVGTKQMANLPSLTRNAYDFVALSGNVSGGDSNAAALSNKSGQNDSFYGVGYSMNGQRSTGTEILLDGMENNDLFGDAVGITVPLDTVNEYRVLTSNFDPQYGRASGGVVNVITKSGSNAFHGDAWEYNRLAAYTANTVYNAQNGQSKGSYTRNQFGYTIGGPIIKDKLFFFGSTEWLRVRSSAVVQSAVPTPQLLALSDPAVQAYFNAYGNNNFNFSQTISAGDAGITAPGVPSSTPAFGIVAFNSPTDAGGGVPQNTYNIVLRGDYNINDRTSMFIRSVYYHEVDQAGANYHSPYSQYNVGGLTKQQATLLSVSHIFSPALATTGKISFSRLIANDSFDTALAQVPTLFVSANATVPGTGFPIQASMTGRFMDRTRGSSRRASPSTMASATSTTAYSTTTTRTWIRTSTMVRIRTTSRAFAMDRSLPLRTAPSGASGRRATARSARASALPGM